MSETSTLLDYTTPGARLHEEPHIFFDSLGFPAHHFQDAHQQKEAATLGMWLFLATELLLFGGMFCGYFAYRAAYPHAWEIGSKKLYWWIGSLNTAVLLTSSLFVALAIHAAHLGSRKWTVNFLLLTILMGATFLGVKAVEYYIDYREHLIPWFDFDPEGVSPRYMPQVRLFMTFYFIMTIIHAIHMIAGMGVMSVITFLAHRGKYSPKYYTPVEMAGLYWHFVDVVWVFLLPALYLCRPYH